MSQLLSKAVAVAFFAATFVTPKAAEACDVPPPPGVPYYYPYAQLDPYAQLEAEREATRQAWEYRRWRRFKRWQHRRWEHDAERYWRHYGN